LSHRRDRWQDSWWAWAGTAFLVHASLVAILLKVRGFKFSGWSEHGVLPHVADNLLHATDFWVYEWIIPRLNNERFGLPFIRAGEIVGIRRLDTLLFYWEFVILAVFGGAIYVALVIAVWARRRDREGFFQRPPNTRMLADSLIAFGSSLAADALPLGGPCQDRAFGVGRAEAVVSLHVTALGYLVAGSQSGGPSEVYERLRAAGYLRDDADRQSVTTLIEIAFRERLDSIGDELWWHVQAVLVRSKVRARAAWRQ
jgi:hypothetical protein